MRLPDNEFNAAGKVDELMVKVQEALRALTKDVNKLPIEYLSNKEHLKQSADDFRSARVQLNFSMYPADDTVKYVKDRSHNPEKEN